MLSAGGKEEPRAGPPAPLNQPNLPALKVPRAAAQWRRRVPAAFRDVSVSSGFIHHSARSA